MEVNIRAYIALVLLALTVLTLGAIEQWVNLP